MHAYQQFASVYDRLMEDMPYPEWLRFAKESWERYGIPKTIVDLGCGTGSLAIPFARAGYQVYGIDLSDEMLAIGRSKWEESPHQVLGSKIGSIRWLQQDMCAWEVPELVDAVVSFCDCVNYLTEEEDVEAAFQATYKGLKPGGIFLFDVHAPKTLERYAENQPFILDEQDVAYIWTCDLDEERIQIEHRLTIFARVYDLKQEQFTRIEEVHVQRAYDPDWIQGALLRAGFSQVDSFGDFKLEAPGEDTERLFFAAVK